MSLIGTHSEAVAITLSATPTQTPIGVTFDTCPSGYLALFDGAGDPDTYCVPPSIFSPQYRLSGRKATGVVSTINELRSGLPFSIQDLPPNVVFIFLDCSRGQEVPRTWILAADAIEAEQFGLTLEPPDEVWGELCTIIEDPPATPSPTPDSNETITPTPSPTSTTTASPSTSATPDQTASVTPSGVPIVHPTATNTAMQFPTYAITPSPSVTNTASPTPPPANPPNSTIAATLPPPVQATENPNRPVTPTRVSLTGTATITPTEVATQIARPPLTPSETPLVPPTVADTPTRRPTYTPTETETPEPYDTPEPQETMEAPPTETPETPYKKVHGFFALSSLLAEIPDRGATSNQGREDPLDAVEFIKTGEPTPTPKVPPPPPPVDNTNYAPALISNSHFLDRRKEFKKQFESDPARLPFTAVVAGSSPSQLMMVDYETSVNQCYSGAGFANENRVRHMTVTEAEYYEDYLAERLGQLEVVTSTNRCFHISDDPSPNVARAKVMCPYFNDELGKWKFHIKKASEVPLAGSWCVYQRKKPSFDTSDMFFEGLKTIPAYNPNLATLAQDDEKFMTALDLDVEARMTWLAQVGHGVPGQDAGIARLLALRGIQPIPVPGVGRWEAYIGLVIKNFNGADDIIQTLRQGAEYCSVLWSLTNQNNYGISWKTLHTALFPAFIPGGRCDKDPIRIAANKKDNFAYVQEVFLQVAGGGPTNWGLTERMDTRRVLARRPNNPCALEFFSDRDYAYFWAATIPLCYSAPVIDVIPIASTGLALTRALSCSLPNGNCGKDAALLYAGAALSAFMDLLPGVGAVGKAAKATALFAWSATRFAVKNPGRLGRMWAVAAYEAAERAALQNAQPSRMLTTAFKGGAPVLFSASTHGSAVANVRGGLSAVLGAGPVAPRRAVDILVENGFLAEVKELVISDRTYKFVRIIEAPAGDTWSRLNLLMASMRKKKTAVAGSTPGTVELKLGDDMFDMLIDTSDEYLGAQGFGGIFLTGHRVIVLPVRHVTDEIGEQVTKLHELIHLNDMARLFDGNLSQYIGALYKLGKRTTHGSGAYINFDMTEVKAWLASDKGAVNRYAAILRENPDLANVKLLEAAAYNHRAFPIFQELLRVIERTKHLGSFVLDIRDFAIRALQRDSSGKRVLSPTFLRRNDPAFSRSWADVYADLDIWFVQYEIKPVGKAVIPLEWGPNIERQALALAEKEMLEPDVARAKILETVLDARLNKYKADGNKAWASLENWFEDGLELEWKSDPFEDITLGEMETKLRELVTAVDRATPREHIKLANLP